MAHTAIRFCDKIKNMEQIGGALKRVLRYARAFVAHSVFSLVVAAIFVALSRALNAYVLWNLFGADGPFGTGTPRPYASPLGWLGMVFGWLALAWLTYLILGWLQYDLHGFKPDFLSAVGAALGSGLPYFVINLLATLVFITRPVPVRSEVYGWAELITLLVLAVLLPAMMYAAIHAAGFRTALSLLLAALTRPGYGRLLIRPGFLTAFAILAFWLVAAPRLGGPGLYINIGQPMQPQFRHLLMGEALRGFLTTLIGLPLVAAVLRTVYDVIWGLPANATPAPADA